MSDGAICESCFRVVVTCTSIIALALLKSLETDNFYRFRSTREIHGSVNTGGIITNDAQIK